MNKQFETSCPGIFALGDCASTPYELTPVATAEGMILSEFLFSKNSDKKITYENIPTAVFTHPPVGTVGLTEEQALKQNYKVEVFENPVSSLKTHSNRRSGKNLYEADCVQRDSKSFGLSYCGRRSG